MRDTSRTAVVLATAFSLLAISAVGLAKPPDESGVVERATTLSGLVYSGDGVHVLTGPPLEDGCPVMTEEQAFEVFPTPTGQFINRPNGTSAMHFRSTEGIHVFDDLGIADVFEWLGMACGALLDGDPSTVAPIPLATGTGTVTYTERIDADGVQQVHNKVVGKVITQDGKRVHLSTFAKFFVDESGLTLTALRVNYGG